MSFISDLIAPVTGSMIKDIGDTIKKFVTTDADRLAVEVELETIRNKYNLDIANLDFQNQQLVETNTTQRWLSDNTAGGLPAITRPLLIWWLAGLFTIIVLSDGNIGQFHIKEAYIPIIQQLLLLAFTAYFGLRTFEKFKGVHNDDTKGITK